jgi:acetylornithine/succinyldiaminopimelate/putrescine aminotransferase
MSLMGDEKFRNPFRPLMPDVRYIHFNDEDDLEQITERTACVMVEPIQAEAGIRLPREDYLKKLRRRCDETGTLLIFDEVQTGFGRTGSLFAMIKYGVYPDIFTIAKAMGGGMPTGAFVASREVMEAFQKDPGLGHITTFGGHPVSVAAAHASLRVLLDEQLVENATAKGERYLQSLSHPRIRDMWGTGLFIAVELEGDVDGQKAMRTFADHGLITDQFIFRSSAFRIAPPLTITLEEIDESIRRIGKALDSL